MMAVIFLNTYFKCSFLMSKSLHISMKDLQDAPKSPKELIEKINEPNTAVFMETICVIIQMNAIINLIAVNSLLFAS